MFYLYGWYYGWYDEQKLKTGLRLSVQRTKLMSKKKTDLVQKARQDIAEYIESNRYDRARICVEQTILEEYFLEGMDLIEMYCDLLLSRFGLIESLEHCDETLLEAVTSIIWATPRLVTECPDLQTVTEHFIYKYGEEFGEEAKSNKNNKVNERVLSKFRTTPPSKMLIEKYMIEIAKGFDVPFTPNEKLFEDNIDATSISSGGGYIIGFESQNTNNGFGYGGTPPLPSGLTVKSIHTAPDFPNAPSVTIDDLPDVPTFDPPVQSTSKSRMSPSKTA